MTDTTREEGIRKIAGIIKDIKFAMLTTQTEGGQLQSRPMTTQQFEFDGDLWFLWSREASGLHDLQARPQVNVSFSDNRGHNYVSVSGRGELVEDQAKVNELWSDFYKAYYDGPEDPKIALVKISADGAEYWDGEGRLTSLIKMAAAAVSGAKPKMGENETVKL